MKFHPLSFTFINKLKSKNQKIIYETENVNEDTESLLAIKLPKEKIYKNFNSDFLHYGDIVEYKNKYFIFLIKHKQGLYDTPYTSNKKDKVYHFSSMGLTQLDLQYVASEQKVVIRYLNESYKRINKSFLSDNQTNRNNKVRFVMNLFVHKNELNDVFTKEDLGFEKNIYTLDYKLKRINKPFFLISIESEKSNNEYELQEFMFNYESNEKLFNIEKTNDWNIILCEHILHLSYTPIFFATGTLFYIDRKKITPEFIQNEITKSKLSVSDKLLFDKFLNVMKHSFLWINDMGIPDFHGVNESNFYHLNFIFSRKRKDFNFLNEYIEKIDKLKIYASEKDSRIGLIYEKSFLNLINYSTVLN